MLRLPRYVVSVFVNVTVPIIIVGSLSRTYQAILPQRAEVGSFFLTSELADASVSYIIFLFPLLAQHLQRGPHADSNCPEPSRAPSDSSQVRISRPTYIHNTRALL